MQGIAKKILNRVRGHGRGGWVCTPKDFVDLGSRDAVDKALSRLVKQGFLRRVGRGLYDYPRTSNILKRPAPPNIDAVVEALARRDGISIMPDGIVAAHQLGLTNAVPAQNSYITNGSSRTLQVGGRTIKLRHVSQRLMAWANRPGAPVVRALYWLGENIAADKDVVNTLHNRLSSDIKQDLAEGIKLLPTWMTPVVRQVSKGEGVS
ncbi:MULTISPECIES: DUF6088 family protein [Moorena]|uniref:DUF6088 family protein n=1 Tax=Moorena producens (strain JHB) TaxID=1454205 RepID=A0A1D9FTZ7_MOOP1|nr:MULTISPECIES: DUF6088 family protein [Moorena]NEO92144.1 hypothetical protein [Moorena sp. SIO3G5]NEQ14851.1 hypothetical protein [Moorena sp. SIO3E2]AOY78744.1 DUF6088 family protein [Moorena producens JHB]NEQ10713.1 hypothetical protein [Moorena sp. SIO4E2]NER90182.1 hypothetical protein [Moorena sp. SIO3A2]